MSLRQYIAGKVFVREWPNDKGMLTFLCPGCSAGHTITFGGAETWTWDGNTDTPTFSPSVLVYPHGRSFDPAEPDKPMEEVKPQPRCHSFVRAGHIEFLADSEHALAGQTVDMVDLPERYVRFLDS